MSKEVYGLSCTCHPERDIRYVGQTSVGAEQRLRGHKIEARLDPTAPVHKFILTHGVDQIVTVVLERLEDTASTIDLLEAEAVWIDRYRSENFALLNVTKYHGRTWTDLDAWASAQDAQDRTNEC